MTDIIMDDNANTKTHNKGDNVFVFYKPNQYSVGFVEAIVVGEYDTHYTIEYNIKGYRGVRGYRDKAEVFDNVQQLMRYGEEIITKP